MNTTRGNSLGSEFISLPASTKTWFLDTCVWSEIVESESNINNFNLHFKNNNYLAGLTAYTLFELSWVRALHQKIDNLFFNMRHSIWIALHHDELMDSELKNYPSKTVMKWMPLSALSDQDKQVNNLLTKISENPIFTNKREEFLKFGNEKFMVLEKLKSGFPTSDNGKYTTDQAYNFSLLNGIQYFLKYEPDFLRSIGIRKFLPESVPTQFARSLLLFYKYYIHEQSPTKSDFFDFAHISYLPYVDYYIAEKNISNVINHIKTTGPYFNEVQIMNVSQFVKTVLSRPS